MIVIPEKKFIFLRVPRTASTSLSHFLLENMKDVVSIKHTPVYYSNYRGPNPIFNPDLIHANVGELVEAGIIDPDTVVDSRIFAVVRDPIDRFISYAYHINLGNTERDINKLVEKTIMTNLPQKQSNWLLVDNKQISDICCFNKLSEMTHSIFKYLGIKSSGNIYYSHRSEERENKSCVIDKNLEKAILDLYHEDQTLYVEALNKNG